MDGSLPAEGDPACQLSFEVTRQSAALFLLPSTAYCTAPRCPITSACRPAGGRETPVPVRGRNATPVTLVSKLLKGTLAADHIDSCYKLQSVGMPNLLDS